MRDKIQLRMLVSEALEALNGPVGHKRLQTDLGFLKPYKMVKSRVVDGARTFRFEFRTDDGSYYSHAFFVEYPDGRWKVRIETDWKVRTRDNTSGAGKDFTMDYGPFSSYEEMASELNRKLTNNPLIGPDLYRDNSERMLDKEIIGLLKKIKESIEEIKKLNHPSLNPLIQVYDAVKDVPDEGLEKFCDDNFKGWLLKQGVIYKLQDVNKIPFYRSVS